MRRITKHASLILALALAVAALVPSVAGAYVHAESGAGDQAYGITERTPTELAQRQSVPQPAGITERTPTELAQRHAAPASALSEPAPSQATGPGGFDWGDAAIGAGVALALGVTGAGIVVVIRRQRRSTPSLGAVRS
jgi:hypothetical protein